MAKVACQRLIDARVDASQMVSSIHDSLMGGSQINVSSVQPTSASVSSMAWQIRPANNVNTYVSRRINVRYKLPLKLTLNAGPTAPSTGTTQFAFGSDFVPCALPFNSLINQGTVGINASSFTTQLQQILPALKRRIDQPGVREMLNDSPVRINTTARVLGSTDYNRRTLLMSATPAPIDTVVRQHQPASSWAQPILQDGVFKNTFDSRDGVMRNNLADGLSNADVPYTWTFTNEDGTVATTPEYFQAQNPLTDAAGSQQKVVYGYLEGVEPLLLQPFEIDDNLPYFINLSQMTVRLNLTTPDAPLARILRCTSHEAREFGGGFIEKYEWNMNAKALEALTQATRLEFTQITPPSTANQPTNVIYPTTYLQVFPKEFRQDTIKSAGMDVYGRYNNPVTLRSDLVNPQTCPAGVFIYAIVQREGATGAGNLIKHLSYDDELAPIRRLSIQWNNNPLQCTNWTPNELWRRTCENGLKCSYPLFDGRLRDTGRIGGVLTPSNPAVPDSPLVFRHYGTDYTGSVGWPVMLLFNKDIVVEAGVGAGTPGLYSMTVEADVQTTDVSQDNSVGNIKAITLMVVPFYTHYLTLGTANSSEIVTSVLTEGQLVDMPVSGDLQSKVAMEPGEYSIMGPTDAGSRAYGPPSRLLSAVARSAPGALSTLSTAATSYVGEKRPRFDV